MAEYLAPGVYVEEIPSGNKPIQAASTSTAGMVGMTARGPVGTPTLVSSRGAYARIFGGDLDPRVFTEGRDALPYAAEGFFTNGGTRLYVVRVVGADAEESELALEAVNTGVTLAPTLAAPASEGDTTIVLAVGGDVDEGTRLLLSDGAASELVVVSDASPEARPVLGDGLRHSYVAGAEVTPQVLAEIATALTADAKAGASALVVEDQTRFTPDTAYLLTPVGPEGTAEYVTVESVDAATSTLTLSAPLAADHATTDTFTELTGGTATALTDAAAASGTPVVIRVDDASGIVADGVVQLHHGDEREYARVTAIAQEVGLQEALTANHAANRPLVPSVQVLTVHARYPGSWGDALRVSAGASSLMSSQLVADEGPTARTLRVGSAIGLYPGSVLVIGDDLVREVSAVDVGAGIVTLTAAHGRALTTGTPLASREFSLTVDRIEGDRAAESETFDRLSLAAEHPRYAPTVVGSWDENTDRGSEGGGSNLIRLQDDADENTRLLPLITGVERFLTGGDDDLAGVDEEAYVGEASDDPAGRTGIQALENEPTLSIVAVPGQTSVTVQKALIDHCDGMRYRFAVLDTPLGASLQAARSHRQNYDTTRAGVYYPALEIADRFGVPGERRVIPPSGHVLGVYARTDITRGVHKAPANEVVRGVLAFDQKLDKAAQDILNPLNLNCLRDFRTDNRGLRVYGARVATSDPEWRYVNVRRLFLFIEQSLDTGLQWAVFEPNSEQLWATVKQSITSFLITVWRSGALEGAKPEEAFFVNVGYDITMTQDDVDNGRLIIEIGAAPVKPAEFVVVRISQKTREAVS
jgi:uncharacterized protein